MSELPNQPSTTAAIYAAIEKENNPCIPRAHLGASIIGRACEREIWHTFRWSNFVSYEGRLLRLFERGKREEAELVKDLRRIGVTVHEVDPETGKQWEFSDHGGHMGGSMDAAAVGFPEAEKTWHVIEFKTHNEKSFDALEKNGVRAAKPEHFAQMQVYMGWSGMDRAMYIAVCKNDDRIYCERIVFDRAFFDGMIAKARRIIFGENPPPRIGKNPAFYACKFCNFTEVCHGTTFPKVNCRTCARSTARVDGTWHCTKHDKALSKEEQLAACPAHMYHPEQLAPTLGDPQDGAENAILYVHPKIGKIVNVAEGATDFSDIAVPFTSRELEKLNEDQLEAAATVKRNFGGTITGRG